MLWHLSFVEVRNHAARDSLGDQAVSLTSRNGANFREIILTNYENLYTLLVSMIKLQVFSKKVSGGYVLVFCIFA